MLSDLVLAARPLWAFKRRRSRAQQRKGDDVVKDYAEFRVLIDGEFFAMSGGPRERALAEILRYGAQGAEDGVVTYQQRAGASQRWRRFRPEG